MAVVVSYQRSLADYDGEKTSFRVNVTVLTAANFDAQATLRSALETAIVGICNGAVARRAWGNEEVVPFAQSSDPTAQRELKWLIQYHSLTSLALWQVELGTPDLALLDANDRSHAAIGDAGAVDAFVDAFEAYVLTPDGQAAVVDEITLVGRNT